MPTATRAAHFLTGFDDPRLNSGWWSRLLARGDTDVVFLTQEWQAAWWDSFGRGELLLVAAGGTDQPTALAPLFADGGMIFFVGSGGSDYLDFIGDVSDPAVLETLLETARARVPNFVGFRFYHVPDTSRTGPRLQAVANRLGLACYDEGGFPSPYLALGERPDAAQAAIRKESLRRHERGFNKLGRLDIVHLRRGTAIRTHLPEFFEQHVSRWAATPYPSLFEDSSHRGFYERLCETADEAGWLRFTRVDCDGRPIAFHFGSCYRGRYLWYKPSFAVELARRSPGEVLLRQLLLAALEEGAELFDFGLGAEAFKNRFATGTETVRTWGLYPTAGAKERARA
jgi:CelD/BcsL family acetyltransferase involved in cellulose biosynthesis